jgi:GDP-mannose 6-dehydrogenase
MTETPGKYEPEVSEALTIALFGLGYVGSVSACCLARAGNRVLGVEIIPAKVAAINRGHVSFVEPGLNELAQAMVTAGRLIATDDSNWAVAQADVSFICVGTPPLPSGAPDYSRLFQVCKSIGQALRHKQDIHDVVIRSTVLPGTADHCARIVSQASGKAEGEGFRILVNPEFLREGSALADFECPPFTVIGAKVEADALRVKRLYAGLSAPLFILPRPEAELIKYSCNLFHAVKVVFSNEVGRLCKAAGVDSHRVMEVFCQDQKLNLSRYYLRPGYAFGGSCLPKDLEAILHYAAASDVELPLLRSVQLSNRQQIELGLRLIVEQGRKRVGLLGLSFKSSTDDLRQSPLVLLAEMLLNQGFELRIFDPNVNVSELLGENKAFLDKHLPRAADLVTSRLEDVLCWAQCLVIGNRLPQVAEVVSRATTEQCIVDLVRAAKSIDTKAAYHGLGWNLDETR